MGSESRKYQRHFHQVVLYSYLACTRQQTSWLKWWLACTRQQKSWSKWWFHKCRRGKRTSPSNGQQANWNFAIIHEIGRIKRKNCSVKLTKRTSTDQPLVENLQDLVHEKSFFAVPHFVIHPIYYCCIRSLLLEQQQWQRLVLLNSGNLWGRFAALFVLLHLYRMEEFQGNSNLVLNFAAFKQLTHSNNNRVLRILTIVWMPKFRTRRWQFNRKL